MGDGEVLALNVEAFAWWQPAVTELLEQRQEPAVAGETGGQVALDQLAAGVAEARPAT